MSDPQIPTMAEIDVRIFAAKPGGKVLAHAEVTVPLGLAGAIRLSGFSIVQWREGEALKIMLPSRKGKERYFDTVELVGRIRPSVEDAILAEYQRLCARPAPESA